MTIQEAYTDSAMNYRVVVSVSNERAIPLKFKTIVSDEYAFAEAQKVLDREAEQAELNSWTPIDFDL